MDIDEARRRFTPAVQEILDLCRVSDDFLDKEMFRVYIATIWGNAVLEPHKTGIEESELSTLHDYLNEEIRNVLGEDEDITSCYRFIVSKEGDESLTRLQISARHKEFLHYFAGLMFDAQSP